MVGELPKSMAPTPEGEPNLDALKKSVIEKFAKINDINTLKKIAREIRMLPINKPINRTMEELKEMFSNYVMNEKTITAVRAIDAIIENIDNNNDN